MLMFLLRRFGIMVLTALCLTFIVFFLTNLTPNLEKLARSEGSVRMSDEQVTSWLAQNGYAQPLVVRYGEWLGVMPGWTVSGAEGVTGRCIDSATPAEAAPRFCGIIQGDWGQSSVFKRPVSEILGRALGATGWLMLWVMIVMVPSALALGVLAGMREGSRTDRVLSTVAIATTATPEYVSGVIFIVIFASATAGVSPMLAEMGWIEGRTLFQGTATSAMDNITFWNFGLPVITVALYGMGYIARMTRASMTEVMTAQYIRTARLKGVRFRDVVIRHALRNALIAPFTVIMLQFPWLLNGVVIVETLFNYKGFGWTLVQGAGNNDIELLLACSVVAVIVVLVTQLISDIGYALLNPRIRIS
ncbi:peptide/nickel transport system permease protein [Pseudorhodobacter antarcticus]|jgi:peptide/nickel transport system permease protein|uniref:Peptide/nickel transport system permease protein n=1 Tax=Pseudorhodobacter antarcticus TaxID=1077947 RepID=A0A1H8DRH0_9RHOB|nr:ABC transporter permease [Pseudorhodobacter antarcticus]SEN09931.1 peptide/nickel transport system permease protein [Pseudorhodobacter antarcticus]